MIDLSNEDTWPKAILEMLRSRVAQTREEKKAELAAHNDGSYLFNPPQTPIYDLTQNQLELLLREHEVRAFHCTKLTDFNEVYRSGLVALSPEFIKHIVLTELRKKGLDSSLIHKAENAFDRFFSRKDFDSRGGMVCFVLTKEMIDNSGCEDFFRYFGGEVTRRALWELEEQVFPVLEEVGVPAVVECSIPIADGADYQISNMAEQFIRYGEKKFLDDCYYEMQCELRIEYTVDSGKILSIWEKSNLVCERNET